MSLRQDPPPVHPVAGDVGVIGTLLRQRRLLEKRTQDDVARSAAISKPYLSNIETGRVSSPPSDGVLARLEAILHFPSGQLIREAHLLRTPEDIRREHAVGQEGLRQLRGVVRKLLEKAAGDAGHVKNAEAAASSDDTLDLESLARKLGLGEQDAPPPGAQVPIQSPAAAVGESLFLRCPTIDDPAAFAIQIDDDAMTPTYQPGDYVILGPAAEIRDGDDVFARFDADGDAPAAEIFRRFYDDAPGWVRLQPLNPACRASVHPRETIALLAKALYRIEAL